ncbi:mycothiol system anti-sigma-R factor [Georgenia sp. AZ-5]|uniref:mycothiol system anti-sigma-R factor n=1 Tax=Georgenia sp. AZ-5 TaxID=3367526 RepID=UPI003754C1E7
MSEELPELAERAERALLNRNGGKAKECTCDELLENLMEFLDSELDEDLCTRYRQHAAQCPRCREASDAEQHIRQVVRRSCAEKAPSTLRLRVESQLTVLRASGVRIVD